MARLIEVSDAEARRLARFISLTVLAIVLFIGFGRYGLADEDSGAPHIIGLVVAAAVCGLNTWILFRSRAAVEALIRGYRVDGIIAALRGGLARAWVAIGLGLVAGLMVFFVFGLSLGLLSYYHAAVSTLGVLIVFLVLERLTERGSHAIETTGISRTGGIDRLVARSLRRLLRGMILLGNYLYFGHDQNKGYPTCVDFRTGEIVWKKDFVKDFDTQVPTWGMTGAPLIDGPRVIVIAGGAT